MRIFLVGFMGSGKSFLGKLWGEMYSIPFYDLDALIEEEERKTVENIFDLFGEDYFREREAAILRNTDRFENCIIACGGGAPCFFDNMQWMNKNGVTVFLNETEQNLFINIKNDQKVRPLINSKNDQDIEAFINKKLSDRLSVYKQSQIELKSDELNKNGFLVISEYIKQQPTNGYGHE